MPDADKERSKEIFHTMSRAKKIQYIFEYYKVVLLLIVIGAVLLPEDNVLVQDGYYADSIYLGISYTAEHADLAETMIVYLLNG